MVEMEKKVESPLDLIRRGIETLPACLVRKRDGELGPIAIELREFVDRLEGISAETVRRFEKSGAWEKDGATDMIAWLKCNGKVWWTRGGQTKLENLALVCGRHHHTRSA